MSDYVYKEVIYAQPKQDFDFMDVYVKKCFNWENEPWEDDVVPEHFMIMFLTRLFVDGINTNANFDDEFYEVLNSYPNIFKVREIVKKYNVISEKMFDQAIDIMIYYNVTSNAFNVYLCDAIYNAIKCVGKDDDEENDYC